jgi:hypothetical protein
MIIKINRQDDLLMHLARKTHGALDDDFPSLPISCKLLHFFHFSRLIRIKSLTRKQAFSRPHTMEFTFPRDDSLMIFLLLLTNYLQHPQNGWGALADMVYRNRHERFRKRLRETWQRKKQLQLDVAAEVQRLTNSQYN